MSEETKVILAGDPEIIATLIGYIVIGWNSCEISIRELVKEFASRGEFEMFPLAEILISELGAVALLEALRCYSKEIPEDEIDLIKGIEHVALMYDRLRAYRNYYIHGINGATAYGIDFCDDEIIKSDMTMVEAMQPGPFGQVWQKTAKGRVKFIWTVVNVNELRTFLSHINNFKTIISAINTSSGRFLRGLSYNRELPELPPLPESLKKPEVNPQSLRIRHALTPRKRVRRKRVAAE